MEKSGRSRVVNAMLVIILALLSIAGTALWLGNRETAAPPLAEREQAYQRAVAWVRNHESEILKEHNSALWWFIQTTAERTGDVYLMGLMRRYEAVATHEGLVRLPWWRMMQPKADVLLNVVPLEPLEPYQRFLYHGVTCQPVALEEGDTHAFLDKRACRPAATQVLLKDPACTTHQLIGVMLLDRMACSSTSDLSALQTDLLDDIEWQMHWDVVVKDAYFQRVMMLMWQGKPEQFRAVWLKRVLLAQQADGGWVGGRQFPELPSWMQPWLIRSKLAAWWPSRFHAGGGSDFHATAQGLLITALAITDQHK